MLFLSISKSKHGEDPPYLLAVDLLCAGQMVRTDETMSSEENKKELSLSMVERSLMVEKEKKEESWLQQLRRGDVKLHDVHGAHTKTQATAHHRQRGLLRN